MRRSDKDLRENESDRRLEASPEPYKLVLVTLIDAKRATDQVLDGTINLQNIETAIREAEKTASAR